ncbi:Phosphate regulon sensor protein PhoR [wastewater metagenome]|uniref:Phosphate regulon sensor protein PhoR n=2 Tax=unclassified sequences TaxID=12908 RepID=A0A5B8RCB8_9ZZZZ|nr:MULTISPECIES: phosphate regulon sensor histidine kinase PhoR [Arhodomonas]MCS4505746.1 phosphate regulon sensor histidine kinase PhoR [Arhodomonas aquaeolei]QEA04337.1 phosphate regulon sensor protein PhoR [uncultured organism]
MMPRNPWPEAWLQVALMVAGALVVGALAGRPWMVLALVLLAWIAWQGRMLMRLERWVRQGRRVHPPRLEGVWAHIAELLFRRQRAQVRRRRRLVSLLHRFKASSDALPDAAVVLRAGGEMEWWNPQAARYLGLRWPLDQGQRVANLLRHPDFAEFLANGQTHEAVKIPSPVDEELTLEIRIVPYGEDRRLLLARDVTRVHRLEVIRRDFVANITHELRTPLTVIQGLSETLAEFGGEPEEISRSLELIDQQTRRMGRLIDDLLLLSRLETADRPREPRQVDVAAMLEGVVEEARALSDGRHVIHLTADPALVVEGDEGELRSAFSNLVVNAVKYTPEGGHIDVRWQEGAGGAGLCVADTGPGIPAHHVPRLTERFYRVDGGRSQASGGTGLGLAIVKHVLSRHGARLDIQSRVGEGSTFCCLFPVYRRVRAGAAERRH